MLTETIKSAKPFTLQSDDLSQLMLKSPIIAKRQGVDFYKCGKRGKKVSMGERLFRPMRTTYNDQFYVATRRLDVNVHKFVCWHRLFVAVDGDFIDGKKVDATTRRFFLGACTNL